MMAETHKLHYPKIWSFFHQIRKIPIKNEEEDEEGHPPGENEETKSEEQSESVWESWKEVLHEMW